MSGRIAIERRGAVAVIAFDNPPRGYLDAAQTAQLDAALDEVAADDAVRAVVFAGAVPGVFVRHYDVGEILGVADRLRAAGLSDEALAAQAAAGNAVTLAFDKIDRLAKPTLAAIDGWCQGGGFELALACDLRIVQAGDFRIGLPETRLGIVPGAGGTERLPRLIGEGRALELILRGRTVTPEEGLALGMVHEMAPQGALPRALELAAELAGRPRRALAEAKALVKNRDGLGPAEAGARARARFMAVLDDPDALRLMRAFLAEGEDINRG
ncbi:MAG: enoyl-CoA hydratase/isomerase family protein [Caulobacteraceae bacterium]